jgi:Flp pilus assembly protein TadB
MDTEGLKELVPHYVALMLLVFLVLTVVRATVGDIGFWLELAVVLVVVFVYRPVVVRLGVAPSGWE